MKEPFASRSHRVLFLQYESWIRKRYTILVACAGGSVRHVSPHVLLIASLHMFNFVGSHATSVWQPYRTRNKTANVVAGTGGPSLYHYTVHTFLSHILDQKLARPAT
jgi:hypothetical protein